MILIIVGLVVQDVRLVEKLMASYPAYIKIVDLVGREDVTDEVRLGKPQVPVVTLYSYRLSYSTPCFLTPSFSSSKRR